MGYILTDTIPGYELVADVTVSVATTSVTIGGLNFGKSDDLLFVSDIYNTAGSTSNYYLYVSGNTKSSDYYVQYLNANGTSVTGEKANYPGYLISSANIKTCSIARLKLTNNGYFVFQSNMTRNYSTTSHSVIDCYGTSIFKMSAITSLQISSTISSAIGIGSRFQLYRRKATLIADTTISGSAVTSVDFTGLNLTAGNEVMLVSEHYNNSGNPCGGSLFPNDNTTVANFYRQNLDADGTTVASVRSNSGYFLQSPTGYYHFNISNIKLTNSGHFVIQSSTNYRNSAPSTMQIDLNYITSTFTLSSITKLSIVTSVAKAISVGSRFQLYLMK